MTWQSLISVLESAWTPCCETPPREMPAEVVSYRCDASFGLPLMAALVTDTLFNPPADSEAGVDDLISQGVPR